MTVHLLLMSQEISEAPSVFVGRIDDVLQGVGAIGLQDVAVTHREGQQRRIPKLEVTLSYVRPGPTQFRATSFSGLQADALAAAFFVSNPSARAHFIRDVGSDHRGSLDQNVIMVIYAESIMPNCGYNRSKAVIVEALAPIAAGASGSAQLVSASGLVTGQVISVVNRFDSTWATGARGYATPRTGSCIWDGFKTCC